MKRSSDPAACNDNQYTKSADRQVAQVDRKATANVSRVANVTTVRNNSKTALPSQPAMRLVTATMQLSAHTLDALLAMSGYRRTAPAQHRGGDTHNRLEAPWPAM